jgi:hypothetical protein
MRVENTGTRLVIKKDRTLEFLLATVIFEIMLVFLLFNLPLHRSVRLAIALVPFLVVSLLPTSYTIVLDKVVNKMICRRRALLHGQTAEVRLGHLKGLTTGYSAWHEMSKVVALTGTDAMGIITLSDGEAYQVIALMDEFLKGIKEGEVLRIEKIRVEKSIYTRIAHFSEKMALLLFICAISGVLVLSFVKEILPHLKKLTSTATNGVVLFFVGTLYFLVSGAFSFYTGKDTLHYRFRFIDPFFHLFLSIALVGIACVMIVMGVVYPVK